MERTCKVCQETKPLDLFVKNGPWRKHTCKVCDCARMVQYQKDNRGSVLDKNRAWATAHPDRIRESSSGGSRRHRAKFPLAAAEATAKWRAKPGNREHTIAYGKAYREQFPEKVRNAATSRRKSVQQATPSWANLDLIDFFYGTSQYMTASTGYKWSVDHVVPLRGKNVSGLHVHNNLLVMPLTDNMNKGNHHG
jgi:hypothetical protein